MGCVWNRDYMESRLKIVINHINAQISRSCVQNGGQANNVEWH